jgi:hypothetical protein
MAKTTTIEAAVVEWNPARRMETPVPTGGF